MLVKVEGEPGCDFAEAAAACRRQIETLIGGADVEVVSQRALPRSEKKTTSMAEAGGKRVPDVERNSDLP
ncbi:MAG: hypothetical protein ACUVRC_10745 [Desulfotomaculales bacterium]